MAFFNKCDICSREGHSSIYHPGECPGVRASKIERLISPFARSRNEQIVRIHYDKSTPKNMRGAPEFRESNPGPYGDGRPAPLRVRRKGRVSVAMPGRRK